MTKATFRYLLAGVLFVLLVGALAWITQFMPRRASTSITQPVMLSGQVTPGTLKFSFTRAIWDPEDDAYALEIEKGVEGHCDFPFENTLNQTADIGLQHTECDCSHMEVCLVDPSDWERYNRELLKDPMTAKAGDWKWTKITESDTKGFQVPASAKGLVRVQWQGRREPGYRLKLKMDVWYQPTGQVRERGFEKLQVPTIVAAPIRYSPGRISVGNLAPGGSAAAEFTVWSSTRSMLDLQWADRTHSLFHYESKPLSPEETHALEVKLRQDGTNTRIRRAYRFVVTVHEKADNKQLDQGPFIHPVNFLLDGDTVPGPQVLGSVKGDIVVGNAEDRGKIDLKTFRAKEGMQTTVSLWTEDQTLLELASQSPPTLGVKLTRGEKTGARLKWELEITVPPNTQFGTLPDDSVIILRTQTSPPRFIRIPVTGNGQS